jgi:predicted phage tail protein
MVNVYLYGILAKQFGKFFKLNVSDCFSALKAIDTNRNNFFKRINYLSKNNINYQIIVDGDVVDSHDKFIEKRKIKNIFIVPTICGSGPLAGGIGGAAASGMGLTAVVAGKTVLTVTGQIVAGLINVAISAAIQVGISLVASAFTKSGQMPVSRISFGGASESLQAQTKSYIFSNNVNLASQGTSIPIGYGKSKVSSKVVWSTIKNYSTDQVFFNQFSTDSGPLIFNNYSS